MHPMSLSSASGTTHVVQFSAFKTAIEHEFIATFECIYYLQSTSPSIIILEVVIVRNAILSQVV